MNQPVLCTSRLTKKYGDFVALRDLDLQVRAGEVVGFLGPNGAGKSTTIRTILDEIRPTSGSATILGLDTHRDVARIRSHIGYLPSDLALYPELTGRETVDFFANLRGGVDTAYADQLAERFDADLSKRVGDLSTGNRQKVGLILAFMHRPDLVIMDEPARGLDPLVQHELQTVMRDTAGDGRSVFLSSHTLSEVQRAADRVGIIRRGELVAVEDVATLRAKAIRRIELILDRTPAESDFTALPGAHDVVVEQRRVGLSYDGEIENLLRVAMDRYQLLDISTEEADLEDIFLTYYRDETPALVTPQPAR